MTSQFARRRPVPAAGRDGERADQHGAKSKIRGAADFDCIIALGSNLGDKAANIDTAIDL